MGMIAGLGALGMGAYGMANNPAQNVQMPQMFQMPGQGVAADQALSGIGNLSNFNTYNIPQAQRITQGLVNNPYASQFQQGAGQAGQLGQLQALGQFGVGQGVTGMGMNQLAPYAGAVMNTAFDPQQALYQRTLQQVQDQSGAQNAMAGVGTTPYGAGLTDMATKNFNIDWQNQQLGRQVQGLGAAGGALQQAGGLAQLGQGMSAAAPGQYLQSSGIPYSTFGQIGGAQMGALSGLGQYGQNASALQQQQIQDYLNYIGQGTGATSAATGVANAGLNQAGMGFGQNFANMGLGMYGLGQIGARGYGIPGFGSSTGWGNIGQSVFGPGGWNYH